jgi:predicted RNA-binding protein with PUA-like domain
MKEMRKGDLGFFYHSNAKPSGVVGILSVVEEAKVDESAFDAKNPYYDPKSNKEKPRWFCVGVEYVKKFEAIVDLHKIKSHATKGGPLENMQLIKNGRLSVCRVTKDEWNFVLALVEGTQTKEESGAVAQEDDVGGSVKQEINRTENTES